MIDTNDLRMSCKTGDITHDMVYEAADEIDYLRMENKQKEESRVHEMKARDKAQREVARLELVIAKHKEVINEVEKIVFNNFDIPVAIREQIQRAIYKYVTKPGGAAN